MFANVIILVINTQASDFTFNHKKKFFVRFFFRAGGVSLCGCGIGRVCIVFGSILVNCRTGVSPIAVKGGIWVSGDGRRSLLCALVARICRCIMYYFKLYILFVTCLKYN